jgi:hypothetical protein
MFGYARAPAFAGLLALLSGLPCRAPAGVIDTPLPQFADGKSSATVLIVPGVVKRGRLQTDFLCTSLAGVPVDIGVEVFDSAGVRLNDVGAGMGAVLDVGPSQTVTIGTSAITAFLETITIPLATVDVEQGSARVVASASEVQCAALLVDDAVAPPVALGTIGPGVDLGPGPGLAGRSLPQFADAQVATHAAVFPGLVKRARVETNVFCTSLAPAPVNLGVEVFAADGSLLNAVAAGQGAVLGVAPGATVTFGTTGTDAFLETTVIVLPGVAQGMARVVSTSAAVRCAAQVVDAAVTPPVSLSELVGYASAAAQPTPSPTLEPTLEPTQTSTAAATATATATSSPAASATPIVGCTGDCNGNDRVTIEELIRGVSIALGSRPLGDCEAFDFDRNGAVSIAELVRAVGVALSGCIAAAAQGHP